MLDFDVRTALLITGLLYLLMPIIAWIVLARQRSPAVALWCVGGLLIGVTAILVALQGTVPDWVTFSISAMTFHGANLLRIQSLRLDLGIPWRPLWMVLGLGVIVLIFNGIHYWLGDAVLRGQFASLVGAALIFQLSSLAWRIGREEQSPSAKWIAWIYVVAGLALLFRAVTLVGFTGTVGLPTEGLASRVLAVVMLLAAVIGHFGYVGMHLDRSIRRELEAVAEVARDEENRHLSEQIAQLDRQRSLGEMSASLGHELNQPLTAILTNAQVARRGLRGGRFQTEQLIEFLDKIIHNTQRASQIIERIRGFIRPATSRNEPVDLHLMVCEVAELVAAEARSHKVKLVFSEQSLPLWVAGDPIQISQIVLNVLRNAIEALKQVAQREIQIECLRADGRAILRIRDSGPGLTPELLAQVGKPFFTTKPTGLGMGISISRSIAAQHGGTLSIANAETGGTLVELILPALPQGNS